MGLSPETYPKNKATTDHHTWAFRLRHPPNMKSTEDHHKWVFRLTQPPNMDGFMLGDVPGETPIYDDPRWLDA